MLVSECVCGISVLLDCQTNSDCQLKVNGHFSFLLVGIIVVVLTFIAINRDYFMCHISRLMTSGGEMPN